MKTISFILIISIIHFISCSSTYTISHSKSAYDELNEELEGERGEIILTNGDLVVGKNIKIWVDSLSCVESNSEAKMFIPTLDIKKIAITNHWRGAWDGFRYGALIGGVTGLIVGIAAGLPFDPEEDGGGWGGAKIGTLGLIFGIGINAGLIGLPIGAIIGHTDKYVLNMPADLSANWREGPHLGFSKYTPFLGLEFQKDHFGFYLGLPGNIGFKYYPNKKGYGWFFGINAVGYTIDTEETKNGDKYDEKKIQSVGLGAGHKWRFKKHWDLTISLSINSEWEELYGDETYRDQYVSVWPTITLGYTF